MYLISHRGIGNHNYAPNTKEAILEVLQYDYIDGVEFDIRMTKDQHLVIIHDPFINLVSNGSGFVSHKTLNDLKRFNFGSDYCYSHISTLEELLVSVHTDKKIVIELKVEGKRYKKLVDVFCNIIGEYLNLNLYVCSFHKKAMKYLKKKKLSLKVGLLIGFHLNNDAFYNHYDFISVSYGYLDQISEGKETFMWTINDILEFLNIKKRNLDVGVITDQASLLEKYLSSCSSV